jgi:hypothetical protein
MIRFLRDWWATSPSGLWKHVDDLSRSVVEFSSFLLGCPS